MASELPDAPDQDALAQIGRDLREARQARGERLSDAAAVLRIRPDHLAALENGDLAGTPGRVYALGFLRSYAHHLGLDGDRLAARLKASLQPQSPLPPASSPRRAQAAIAIALLLISGSILGFSYAKPESHGHDRDEAPFPVAVAPIAPDPVDGASALAAEPAPLLVLAAEEREDGILKSVQDPEGRLDLVGRADGWIQVRSGDRSFVRSGMLLAGQRLSVPRRPDLLLSASDGGSVEILVDGWSLGPAGTGGRALRDLPLPVDPPAAARSTAR